MMPRDIAARLVRARIYERCVDEFSDDHAVHNSRFNVESQIAFCPVCKLVWTPGRGIEAVEALGP